MVKTPESVLSSSPGEDISCTLGTNDDRTLLILHTSLSVTGPKIFLRITYEKRITLTRQT
jgi:hypothetical protein